MLTPIFINGQKLYQDSFGNKYQYDLSDPTDQINYSTDLDAQQRDQLSTTPTRNSKGGGIYE